MNTTDWKAVPGYDGLYWINKFGVVVNSDGHSLKHIESKSGLRVELRKFGQRERLLVEELIERTWGNEASGCLSVSGKAIEENGQRESR